ncbi:MULTISPECIES: hypothetical protein [unclassified Streptomyces]|uniref:hypothetical protein n=1 Tax=unclassified Streptomyces TaxID=2593676 RepID=UPI0036A8EFA1
MTDEEMWDGTGVRPFAVPINDDFAREAVETLRGYREMVEKCLMGTIDPSPDSPLGREMASVNATPDPLGANRGSFHKMLLEIAIMSWDTTLDHVRALEHDIARRPAPVWSPLVLARAALESCLVFDYLCEPEITGALRFARGAGLWRKDTNYSMSLAKILGQDEQGAALDAYITKAFEECNIVARTNTSGKITGYIVDGAVANLDYNITDRTASRLPEWIPMPYGLLSGAAHGRPWMTDRARHIGEGTGALVGEAATVVAALQAVMAALEMGVRTWQGYFGLTLEARLRDLDQYRQLMSLRLLAFAHAAE